MTGVQTCALPIFDVLINMNIFNFDDNNGFRTVKGGGHIPGSDSRSTLKVKI